LDLPDIRASLAEQGWRKRSGKGSHEVWYPPGGSRPTSMPRKGKASRPGSLAALRATLRGKGWVDPEVLERQTLVRNLLASDARLAPTPSPHLGTATQTASAPESVDMPTDTEPTADTDRAAATEPTVELEAWAHTRTGAVSDRIKEQLLSDGTVRYRCAHRYGAGCTYTSDRIAAISAHQRTHKSPAAALAAATTTRRATPVAADGTEPTRKALTAQERTANARLKVAQQAQDALEYARNTGETVRIPAVLPYGLGAGAITETVWLLAEPTGRITFACSSCDFTGDKFSTVFSHRAREHPRNRGERAAEPAPQEQPAAAEEPAEEPQESVLVDVVPGVGFVFQDAPRSSSPTGGSPDAPEPPASAPVSAASAVADEMGALAGPFRVAAAILQSQTAEMIDLLRGMAVAANGRLAALEQDQEMERLRSELAAVTAERDALVAERPSLAAARDQLEQFRALLMPPAAPPD
jgi:hypothetical protein